MANRVEDEATCYHPEQNKAWSVDPEGFRWEWYRVTRNAQEIGGEAVPKTKEPNRSD